LNEISEPPDGLENLARHNLMTYKSIRQPLDGWALDELIGHYVNYRKQSSPSVDKLLPIDDFGLYAVSTRHPEKLATEVALELVKQGVYEVPWGSRRIRIIVLSGVPRVERNAIWQLFSGIPENVQFGALNYHWQRPDHSGIFNDLLQYYQAEGITMPYTWNDYFKENSPQLLELVMKSLSVEELLQKLPVKELLKRLPPEERLKGLPPEERLKGLPPEERLKGLPPEERLKGLPPEERLKGLALEELLKRVPAEEFLKRLSREEIEAYLKKLSTLN
jgi:hypothetical protein